MVKRPDMLGNTFAKGSGPNKTSFKKGREPWNKGKSTPEATRKKQRDAKLAKPTKYWLGKKRADMEGENNPNYGKFGQQHPKWVQIKKRPFYKSIRELFKYVEWRKCVFERDNYTCQKCGKSNCYLEAHHVKQFANIVLENNIETIEDALNCDELWGIDNGLTLCLSCHRQTDTWGKRKVKKD